MKNEFMSATAITMVLALGACALPDAPTALLSEELEPTPAPAEGIAYASRNTSNGEVQQISIEPSADGFKGSTSGGCQWSETERYGPSTSWTNCLGATGEQTIVSESGALWPLAVGNKKSWRYTGKNEQGDDWSGTRTCEVRSAENVTIAAGDFPAYRVRCEDPWSTRIYWHAPSLGHAVYFQRNRKTRNELTIEEYVIEEST